MRLTAKLEYACLAVIALARHEREGPVIHARVIAEDCNIPEPFLARILLRLKTAGLVESTRGAFGGYRLARPAESISLGDVFTAVDDPDVRDPTTTSPSLAEAFATVRRAQRLLLDRVTVAQMAERDARG